MEKLNLPPFYIGQKVVCKENISIQEQSCINKRAFKKGEVFTVNYINFDFSNWWVGFIEIHQDSEYLASKFAPIEEVNLPLLTFEQIKEKEKEEILILN